MKKLKALLLTEGMHGMISQVEGMAKALDVEYSHKIIRLSFPWNSIPPKFTPISGIILKDKTYITKNEEFDLVISLGAFHNLRLYELEIALPEMERVGQNGYLVLESYRNEQELFNLQCWALTAESFLEPSEWLWLYRHFGYSGDYEFIFFE